MDQDLQQKLTMLEQKIDAVHRSSERTRKMFLWTLILGIVVTVLPLLGLLVVIPKFLGTLSAYQGLF